MGDFAVLDFCIVESKTNLMGNKTKEAASVRRQNVKKKSSFTEIVFIKLKLSYLGDGEWQVEILPPLQPEAPRGWTFESDAVVAAHGLLDCAGCLQT